MPGSGWGAYFKVNVPGSGWGEYVFLLSVNSETVAQPESIAMCIWHGPNLQSKTANNCSNFKQIDETLAIFDRK